MKIIIYALSVFVVISCVSTKKNVNSIFVEKNNYKLILNTFTCDTLTFNEYYPFEKLVVRQHLIFENKNLLDSVSVDIPYFKFELNNSDTVIIPENVIDEIGVLEGQNQNIFIITGRGYHNSSPELTAFYSSTGELLYFNYSSKYQLVKEIGNFDSLILASGIDTTKYFNHDYYYEKLELK